MKTAIMSGSLVPVLSVASLAGDAKTSGVESLLEFIKSFARHGADQERMTIRRRLQCITYFAGAIKLALGDHDAS